MNILVLSPHTDDLEFGCGGMIQQLIKVGHEVAVIVFSKCEKSLIENKMPADMLYKENLKALDILGIKNITHLGLENRMMFQRRAYILQILFDYNKENDVDLLLIPSVDDLHQDHEVVSKEALRAFRRSHATILMYEGVATDNFDPNYFVLLTEDELAKKVEALMCYKSQRILRPYFDKEIITGLARHRGSFIGVKYAEAYKLVRGKFETKG